MPMKTIEGYSKEKYTDTSVLLAGGGAKALSDFIGSLTWDSTNKKIKYTPVGGSATDLVTLSWDNISGKPSSFTPSTHSHADISQKWTAYAGKEYIGWVKIIEWTLNTSNQMTALGFQLHMYRSYNSPSPESYSFDFKSSWGNSPINIQQLNGSTGSQIINKLRFIRDDTNHKLYLEYYVNTNYSTYRNTVTIQVFGFGTGTPITDGLVQTEAETDIVVVKEFTINATGASISGTISNATSAAAADTVKVASRSTDASHYLAFVANNNSTAAAESLYTDGGLVYNPSTNRLIITSSSGQQQEVTVSRTGGSSISMMVGTANANHGLYSNTASKWIVYSDASGNVTLNGNATTATTASKLGTADVGSASRPIYLAAGVPTQTTYKMAGTNVTATTALAISTNLDTGIWYVNGTNSTDLYSVADGAAYVNKYSDSWIAEIYQDYRTGQIALRGKNNGTWQAWRKVLDSSNFNTWAPKLDGTGATGTWGISISGDADTVDGAHKYELRAYPRNNSNILFSTLPYLLNGTSILGVGTPVTSMENAPEGLCWGPVTSSKSFYSDYIEVEPGEILYGEIWAYRASGATGTAGTLYYGIDRYDRNKKAIASNTGCTYFVTSGSTVAADGVWHKYTGTTTIPTSHTAYSGSDGKGVYYVKIRVLVNYSSGTIPTYIGRILLSRKVWSAKSADSVAWDNITGKPSTFTPSSHEHSAADITSGTLAIARGGTDATTQADINKNFIAALSEGSSDFTDNTEIISSYASNNGFADTNAPNVPYKRDAIKMYNYIKGKLDSVYSATDHTHSNYVQFAIRAHDSSSAAYTGPTYISTYVGGKALIDRGSWAYANNGYVDTGDGVIPLAGTMVITINGGTSNKYGSAIFVTPSTASTPSGTTALKNEMWFFTQNGNTSSYPDAWTRVLTNRNYTSYTVKKDGTGATGTWAISISGDADTVDGKHASNFATSTHSHSDYVTLTTDQEISGAKTFQSTKWILKASESNEIVNKTWGNSTYYKFNDSAVVSSLSGMTNSIQFRWYNDYWNIGTVRSGSSTTLGFAIGLQNSAGTHVLDIFRVSNDGKGYLKGNEILTTAHSITADSVAWGDITGKPSTFAPASHSHTFAETTSKITNTNEFNFVDAEQATIWFNYRRASGSSATTATTQFNFAQGTKSATYAKVKADGFIKNGSDSSHVLLGDGGHKAVSDFATSGHTHSEYALTGHTHTGYASSTHSHAFADITSKIVNSDEFNFVDAEKATIWINYRRASGSAATTATTQFSFAQGLANTSSYANIKAAGFIKNGSDSSHVLLGDGGHKAISDFAVDTTNFVTISGDQTITGAKTFNSTTTLTNSSTNRLWWVSSRTVNSAGIKHRLGNNICCIASFRRTSSSASYTCSGESYVEGFYFSSVTAVDSTGLVTLKFIVPNTAPYTSTTTIYNYYNQSVSGFPYYYQVLLFPYDNRPLSEAKPTKSGVLATEVGRSLSSTTLTIQIAFRRYTIDNYYGTDDYIRPCVPGFFTVLIAITYNSCGSTLYADF